MRYELCYLVGESKEQDLLKIKEEVKKIVSQEGGSFLEPQIEEKRKMAYKVGKEVRGIYVTQRFEISKNEEGEEEKNPIDSITRKMNLFGDVLRFILIKAEELPELRIKEVQEKIKKDFKKSAFSKNERTFKREEKNEVRKEEKKAEVISSKEKEEPKVLGEKPKEESKSIDEKIDELLNI